MISPVKKLREQHGLTRAELAELLDCTQRAIESYENEERTPRVELAVRMKKLFNCSLDDIYANVIEKLSA